MIRSHLFQSGEFEDSARIWVLKQNLVSSSDRHEIHDDDQSFLVVLEKYNEGSANFRDDLMSQFFATLTKDFRFVR